MASKPNTQALGEPESHAGKNNKFTMDQNRVLTTYRRSGRDLEPHFVQIKIGTGVHWKLIKFIILMIFGYLPLS